MKPPARWAAPPVPPGSRWEQAGLLLALILDLASTPFHLVIFLLTRRAQAARLRKDLEEQRP